jgi:predicted DNA-binding transcriptional regulator YafY
MLFGRPHRSSRPMPSDRPMDRLERFYRIDQLLQERTVVSRQVFLEELEVSPATFKRDLEYMRDRFNAPVIWDADAGGYRYDTRKGPRPRFALPGLWFSEDEAYALVMMHDLLSSLDQGGLIGPHIAPLMARLDAILGAGEASATEVRKRMRLLSFGSRKMPLEHFSLVGAALFKRRRLKIEYYARSTNAHSARVVSPQRLVHYRENWYLDTWCHLRNDLRSFSVDGIRRIELTDAPATEVSLKALDQYLLDSYGIVHNGAAAQRARLRFSAERARWVAAEVWHPQQKGSFDAEGRYMLELPFRDDRELVLDILRHGAEVEVLEPAGLRDRVRAMHAKAARLNG